MEDVARASACPTCGCVCGGSKAVTSVAIQVSFEGEHIELKPDVDGILEENEDLVNLPVRERTRLATLRSSRKSSDQFVNLECQLCPRVFHYATSFTRHVMMHLQPADEDENVRRSRRGHAKAVAYGGEKESNDSGWDEGNKEETPAESSADDLECSPVELENGEEEPKKMSSAAGRKRGRRPKRSGSASRETHACDICNKTFTSRSGKDYHMERHNAVNKPSFECETCYKTFSAKQTLKDHVRLHDPNAQLFSCSHCEKEFPTKGRLNLHLRTRHGSETAASAEYKCETCGKRCKTRSALESHQLRHTGLKSYICELCGKCFYTQEELKGHLRNTHSSERNHTCRACGRAFKTPLALKTHEMTHTGERPHMCDVCGRGFIQKNSMLIHRRTHLGERLFKCDQCDKSYYDAWSLREHTNTHLNIRPFKCEVCGTGFNRYGAMHAHRRVKHGLLGKRKRGVDEAALAGAAKMQRGGLDESVTSISQVDVPSIDVKPLPQEQQQQHSFPEETVSPKHFPPPTFAPLRSPLLSFVSQPPPPSFPQSPTMPPTSGPLPPQGAIPVPPSFPVSATYSLWSSDRDDKKSGSVLYTTSP
ncbi:unnamed protein product [Cyprideis torosa]|uniref:Uncharacterized protein n=1 Tax=Cyprideis torosa TaxID=163714 RepID=A0A7R8WC16_9CRUS|nr:unnamed protein product [Cyprideis torosa]CAG0887057.1 unnamed protein product [Cyprideis torosa]